MSHRARSVKNVVDYLCSHNNEKTHSSRFFQFFEAWMANTVWIIWERIGDVKMTDLQSLFNTKTTKREGTNIWKLHTVGLLRVRNFIISVILIFSYSLCKSLNISYFVHYKQNAPTDNWKSSRDWESQWNPHLQNVFASVSKTHHTVLHLPYSWSYKIRSKWPATGL